MSSLFCCSSIQPFRPSYLAHEAKFVSFMAWATFPREASPGEDGTRPHLLTLNPSYAIQLVRQVNYGPLESKRYFVPTANSDQSFVEITEKDLIQANFQKLNTYKNFRCGSHDKFFEVNVYQKDPVNKHHWRANLARPATDIDL